LRRECFSLFNPGFQKLILLQKPLVTGFAKIVNIDKANRILVQNSKNEFKQNSANQNDKSIGFLIYQFIDRFSDPSIGFVLQNNLSIGFLIY
jgi:hypothetical protein